MSHVPHNMAQSDRRRGAGVGTGDRDTYQIIIGRYIIMML